MILNLSIMNKEINIELEELFKILDNSDFIKEIKRLKKIIDNDKDLISKIEKIKSLNKYDPLYKELRIDIYKNKYFKEYMDNYQKLNMLIMAMNNKFNKIYGGRSC